MPKLKLFQKPLKISPFDNFASLEEEKNRISISCPFDAKRCHQCPQEAILFFLFVFEFNLRLESISDFNGLRAEAMYEGWSFYEGKKNISDHFILLSKPPPLCGAATKSPG